MKFLFRLITWPIRAVLNFIVTIILLIAIIFGCFAGPAVLAEYRAQGKLENMTAEGVWDAVLERFDLIPNPLENVVDDFAQGTE